VKITKAASRARGIPLIPLTLRFLENISSSVGIKLLLNSFQ
jgi:hypothetical protein